MLLSAKSKPGVAAAEAMLSGHVDLKLDTAELANINAYIRRLSRRKVVVTLYLL
jgi:hypothetical protein